MLYRDKTAVTGTVEVNGIECRGASYTADYHVQTKASGERPY